MSLYHHKGAKISLDWIYKGMRTLILENELIRAVILLDKGSDIMELSYKPLDIDVLWHSPTGYRNPAAPRESVNTPESAFGDTYGGGWQDLLPVIGHGPIEHRGAFFGTHGETALLRWHAKVIEEGPDVASVVLGVTGIRYPYEVKKTLTIRQGESKLRIRETLTNTSRQSLEFFWLQHPAYGEPFLAPGCRIDLPEGTDVNPVPEENPHGRLGGGVSTWPIAKTRRGGQVDLGLVPPRDLVAEETTFLKPREPWYALTNPRLKLGVALRWNIDVYPWLWFWQNYNQPESPWYGEAWNLALEPSTSFPGRTAEQLKGGSYLLIEGGASVKSELTASFYTGKERVRGVGPQGEVE